MKQWSLTILLSAGTVFAEAWPVLRLYHSFDHALDRPDFALPSVTVAPTTELGIHSNGAFGKAVAFPAGAADASIRYEVALSRADTGWALTFFNCLIEKEGMMTLDRPFLRVLDSAGALLLTMDISGLVRAFDPEGNELARLDCFDAIYWIGGENIHLALVYDPDGAQGASPRGKLAAYWSARPYGAVYLDFGDRRPATIELGGGDVGGAADELCLFEGAAPMRLIYALSRPPRKDWRNIQSLAAELGRPEAMPPFGARQAGWRAAVRSGTVWEVENAQPSGVERGASAHTASGRAFFQAVKGNAISIPFEVHESGVFALALRYALDRSVDLQWPVRNPDARTAWTHNFTELEVTVDGKEIGRVKLYPTGIHDGHRGDVEAWAWVSLADRIPLGAGSHTLGLKEIAGQVSPWYDALLVGTKVGPAPEHPRWVDAYRIPPAWWVASRKTEIRGGIRFDRYTVSLHNRTDEPYACRIELEQDRLGSGQKASTDVRQVSLAPHEEKSFDILFQTPASVSGSSGYLRVVLWNEDTGSPMEYRLWNSIPNADFSKREHPALVPPPDPTMQARFKSWLETRDPAALTPDLRAWAAGPDLTQAAPEYKALASGAKVRLKMFAKPLLDQRLEMLDFWMAMTPDQFESWLPDASAENHGYGATWDRVNNALTGAWYPQTRIVALEPSMDLVKPGGDLDLVSRVTVEGRDEEAFRLRKETLVRTGSWLRVETPDVFLSLRQVRWAMAFGVGNLDVGIHYPREAGLNLLAEAYYLTGDPRYIRHAAALAEVLARKYTRRTKQFGARLHREDRDWWGSRIGNRYLYDTAAGALQILGTILLDLGWTGLGEEARHRLEHNLARWAMYECSYGPLWDDPDKSAKINREDMPPFIAFARVVGDPGPYEGLEDYYRKLRPMVLDDGIHICSIGSYGGVTTFIHFMKRLHDLGVDVVKGNEALRNAFLNHVRFTFSCGSVQPMDDGGGGQSLLGLGPVFGAPNEEQYAWGYTLYQDPLLRVMPDFLIAMSVATRGHGAERAQKMAEFYTGTKFPLKTIWPPVFIAPVKGMAMLRNWRAPNPLDWIEVLADYGKYGGRFHGHPNKLSILTAYNGQVGSCDHGDSLRNAPENNNEWTMGGYSHNTVQVNFRHHRTAGGPVQIGDLLEAGGDEEVQWVDTASRRMFPGILMRRTTFVTDAGIVDFFLCRSEGEHLYDWPYHNFGIASTLTPLAPTNVSSQGLLRFVRHARAGRSDGLIQVVWKDEPLSHPPRKGQTSLIGETVYARLWALPEAGTELLLFAGPAPAGLNEEKEIDYALLRRRAASTVFACVIEPWRESTGPRLQSVERLSVLADGRQVSDVEAYGVKIKRTDGREQFFVVNYSGGVKQVGPVKTAAPLAVWEPDAKGQAQGKREGKGRIP